MGDKKYLSLVWVFMFCAFTLLTSHSHSYAKPFSIELKKGLHLFIDDYLIGAQSFLSRTVNNPEKLPEPIITGGKDGDQNFQPYMSVLRDPETGRFRIWYGTPESANQSHIGYLESEDGINWIRPHQILKDPHVIKFGITVLDRGKIFADPSQRYVFASYLKDGLMIATSPDGLDWTALTDNSVLKHNHDITSLHRSHQATVFVSIRSNCRNFRQNHSNSCGRFVFHRFDGRTAKDRRHI
ncbi:MAG: hypothetical protein SCK70_04295 [bacterium]|nr:hypothetical protein [bacterium]